MIRTIRLHGELGKKFGEIHNYYVATAAESVRALIANLRGFEHYLISSEKDNVGYKVLVNDEQIIPTGETMAFPLGKKKTIDIVPVIGGAKSGFLGIVIGAALIATAVFVPGLGTAALFTLGSWAPTIGSVLFSIGTSLVLGGITSLLAPQPKSQSPAERPENKPSYYFNGPVNTILEGNPVPIGYGRLYVGSSVVSGGLTADDYTEMDDFA